MRPDPLGHSLMHHFAQANPKGAGQGDVPALLRRVADTLDDIPDADVMDLILHDEITEDGSWYSLTLYYALPTDNRAS
jgi:hypothetical protein